jgi:hypothetical protein
MIFARFVPAILLQGRPFHWTCKLQLIARGALAGCKKPLDFFGVIGDQFGWHNCCGNLRGEYMLTTNPAPKNNDPVPYPTQDTTPPEVQKVSGPLEKTAENLAYYILGNPWKTAGLLLAAVTLGILCERRRRG